MCIGHLVSLIATSKALIIYVLARVGATGKLAHSLLHRRTRLSWSANGREWLAQTVNLVLKILLIGWRTAIV
jgi:hypothetical protein